MISLLVFFSAIAALFPLPSEAFTVPTRNYRFLKLSSKGRHGYRQSSLQGSHGDCDSHHDSVTATTSTTAPFDPFDTSSHEWPLDRDNSQVTTFQKPATGTRSAALATALTPIILLPSVALAATNTNNFLINTGDFNPDTFRPVCPASDGLYRFLQGTTQSIVGPENFVQYGPLIAGGLLRVRLELCVVESFFNEAVGPFIDKEGLSWILPLHETVETFLAGTIFAVASTFILVGSTKIVSVLVTYVDVFIGAPCRLFGGFFFDRAKGKPVTLDIGFGPFKKRIVGPGSPKDDANKQDNFNAFDDFFDIEHVQQKNIPIVVSSGVVKGLGVTSKLFREVLEATDLFVGRYLTLIATGYIGFKFLHFKVFPDFPPF